jgi:uncharacterized protein YbjT (DUF2867 family)
MILVIGATGTVGGHVVRQLVAAGDRPRAFVRDPAKARQRLGERVDLAPGDLSRPETIDAALDGIDRVFLLTATSSNQLDHERNTILAARRANVAHVVKLSVLGADRRSPLQHARWQAEAELLLKQSDFASTILHVAFLMQNLFFMVRRDAIETATENGRVAMVDARDVAAAATAALTRSGHEGRSYVLTGPEALSFDDTARILSAATGRQIKHVEVSPDDVRQAIRGMHADDWYADDVAIFNQLIAAGQVEVVTDDVRDLTGHPPKTVEAFGREFSAMFRF